VLAKPFGAYRNTIHINDIYFDDSLMHLDVKNFLKVRDAEERLNLQFNVLSSKMGLRDTHWGQLAIKFFGLWTILTTMVCYEKPDFLNATISALGLAVMLDP
jgi:hypothetical protein